MINKTFIIISAALLVWVQPVSAEEIDAEKKYASCMKLAKAAPQKALEEAITWAGLSGGDAAKHCIAVALLGLKQYKQAAIRLETLADNIQKSKEFKAALLGQAGQAWLVQGNLSKADNVLTTAIYLDPKNWALYVDRAQVAALQKDLARALKDLDHALDNEPNNVDALVFRASAKRQLNQSDGAVIDIGRALSIEDGHLEGLLERGILRLTLNDLKGARADWQKIIKLASKSEAARLARANLKRLGGLQVK